MKKYQLPVVLLFSFSSAAHAVDYLVDFTRVTEMDVIRPLIENCDDFGALEHFRDRLETTANLEELRGTLTNIGFGMFNDCPEGIAGNGIEPVAAARTATTTGYSVDFTRVEDFESLRPLVENCTDFGALEHFRDKLEGTANLDDMRKTLMNIGFGMFDECPENVTGPGITPVK